MAATRWLLISFLVSTVNSLRLESLNGDWIVNEENGKYNNIPAKVPGGIYSDLMNNKIIDDIFYGYNDMETRWVANSNWTYSRTFSVDENLLSYETINLVFEGLDTFASIYVNDVLIGSSENMFVRYIFSLKNVIKLGNNSIEVKFISPVQKALDVSLEQDYDIPPDCHPDEYNGDCHVNQIRKMQASFSWDWGPSFPSVGIWKDIYIEAFSTYTIRYMVPFVIEVNETQWELIGFTYFESSSKRIKGKLSMHLDTNKGRVHSAKEVDQEINVEGEIIFNQSMIIDKEVVDSWWPNGYGDPILYTLTVQFEFEDGIISFTRKFGFRKVELVQEQLSSGLSFYFKVNGIPIFAKGSNEIPINILPERGYDEKTIDNLLISARDANMNMLRVWGGGVYESDYFYDAADRYGIMIWQDFMFACALYSSKDSFLENVRKEVRHQVRRIVGHASVVLLSGNNENEGALRDDWYGVKDNFTLYKNDYVKLYIDTIQAELKTSLSENVIFVPSSPSNGDKTIEEGYVAEHPGDSHYGDVHFYNYEKDPWEAINYPIPRFASEYGQQSFPSEDTLLTATDNISNLNINSEFMYHRQHHPKGNTELLSLISLNLQLPDESHQNYYKAFIYYSQIMQAMATKTQSEHYRSYRSILNSEGLGLTMGALYWQLNDVWVAPTWSGIDYYGNWKMLHFFAKNFFAPVIVTASLDNERNMNFYVISDKTEDLANITLLIKVYKYDSLTPLKTIKSTVDIPKLSSKLETSLKTDSYLSEIGCETNQCFFHFVLQENNEDISPENFAFPGKLKDATLPVPNISISITENIGFFDIVVKTDQIALFVWLDSHAIKGRFNQNGFVQVTEKVTVQFIPNEAGVRIEDLEKQLTVTNLRDKLFF